MTINYFYKLLKSVLLCMALISSGMALLVPTAQAVNVSVKNFRGTWNAAAHYRAGDVVGYQNQSYIAQQDNNTQTPAAGSPVWYLLAAQGPQGTAGTNGTNGKDGKDGLNGKDGINGKDGAQGPKGDTGPNPVYAYQLVVGQNPASGDGTNRTLAAPDYTTINAALNAIPATTDSNGNCTSHYLVKVLPGVYSEDVTMKPCVDIEGSGEYSTTIVLNYGVQGADQSELRMIGFKSIAQLNLPLFTNHGNSRLNHVLFGTGFSTGILVNEGAVSLDNVTMNLYGVGIDIGSSSVAVVRNSSIISVANSIQGFGIGNVINTQINRASSTSITLRCVGAYNAEFIALNAQCQ